MRPTNAGRILGIPSPKQWWVGDGPIEPRLVSVAGRVLVTFNAAMAFSQQRYMDFTVLWDIDNDLPIIPRIEGGIDRSLLFVRCSHYTSTKSPLQAQSSTFFLARTRTKMPLRMQENTSF